MCRITLYCLPWRKTGGTGGNFNWRLTFFIYVHVVSHKNEFKIFKNSDWLTLIFEHLVFTQAHLFCSLIIWNRDDRLAHVNEICYINKWAYNDCLGPWDRSENTAWLPRPLTQKVNSDSKRLSELQKNCMRLVLTVTLHSHIPCGAFHVCPTSQFSQLKFPRGRKNWIGQDSFGVTPYKTLFSFLVYVDYKVVFLSEAHPVLQPASWEVGLCCKSHVVVRGMGKTLTSSWSW